jgi:hypothetical protein
MNEVAIHRGRYPHLSVVDAYVDGQHLTEAVVSPISARTGRWSDPRYSHGFDSVLFIVWRSYRPSRSGGILAHTNSTEKFKFQDIAFAQSRGGHDEGEPRKPPLNPSLI